MLRKIIITGILVSFHALLTPLVNAYSPENPQSVINSAAPSLTSTVTSTEVSGGTPQAIFEFLAEEAALLVTGIAIIIALIGGLRLAFSQSEEAVSVARRTFINGLIAIGLVALARIIRNALYRNTTVNIIADPDNASTALCLEAYGIIDLLQVPLISIAVLMIIINGIRAVVSYGSDDGAAAIRRTVIATVAGVTLIAIREVFVAAVTGGTNCTPGGSGAPDPIVVQIVAIMNRILGFIGLAAVVVIVIAGIMMIANLGNDDQYNRARNLIVRVVIGLVVILISLGLVNLLVTGITS